jgi:hypothetical protein
MSFSRHGEIYRSDVGWQSRERLRPRSRRSSASMSLQPAIPWRVALPQSRLRFTGQDQDAVMSSYRSIEFQRTANTVLTVCVSQGDNPSSYTIH